MVRKALAEGRDGIFGRGGRHAREAEAAATAARLFWWREVGRHERAPIAVAVPESDEKGAAVHGRSGDVRRMPAVKRRDAIDSDLHDCPARRRGVRQQQEQQQDEPEAVHRLSVEEIPDRKSTPTGAIMSTGDWRRRIGYPRRPIRARTT